MKWIAAILSLMGSLHLYASKPISYENWQAMAFFGAKDYQKAKQIEESLLHQNLPEWQRATLLYNLATIELTQKEWNQATKLFESISLDAISYPLLLRYLKTNEGVAKLLQAESSLLASPENQQERVDLLEEGLTLFREAEKINCQIQAVEELVSHCLAADDLSTLSQLTTRKLNQARQGQRAWLLSEAPFSVKTLLLMGGLQKFLTSLSRAGPSSSNSLQSTALKQMGEALIPLWDSLKKENLTSSQHALLLTARQTFTEAIESLQQKSTRDELEGSIKQSIDKLRELEETISQPSVNQKSLLLLLLKEQLALLDENLSIPVLSPLLQEQQRLEGSFSEDSSFMSSLEALRISNSQLQAGQQNWAQFFLLYSATRLQNSSAFQVETKDPSKVLQRGLTKAKAAWKLNRLAQSQTIPDSLKKTVFAILKETQADAVSTVQPFVNDLLTLQTSLFRQLSLPKENRCQKSPWDRVVPLFELGYKEALQANEVFALNSPQFSLGMIKQEHTLTYWKQALQLIKQAQQPSPSPQHEKKLGETRVNREEILNLIPQMLLEDAPTKQQGASKELHGW